MIYNKSYTKKMLNHIQNYLKRNIYNSNLNRKKCIVNKKKYSIQKSITRNFCTYNQKDPEPNNDWWFIIMASITAFSVGKINGTKRR